MSARIAECFANLRAEGRKGLIPFIMAGHPSAAVSRQILHALPKAGADIIEIGIPFSDPMADGPIIETAGLQALAQGMTLKKVLAMVAEFRAQNVATPIVLMGYYNPLYRYGAERFCVDAAAVGVDGVIIVDLPPEEEAEFTLPAATHGIALIRLIAPTTGPARLAHLLESAQGFVYYVAVAGITGTRSADPDLLAEKLAVLRAATSLPIAVGFGIKTPEQAALAARASDAVVVGSALVERMSGPSPLESVHFVAALKRALK